MSSQSGVDTITMFNLPSAAGDEGEVALRAACSRAALHACRGSVSLRGLLRWLPSRASRPAQRRPLCRSLSPLALSRLATPSSLRSPLRTPSADPSLLLQRDPLPHHPMPRSVSLSHTSFCRPQLKLAPFRVPQCEPASLLPYLSSLGTPRPVRASASSLPPLSRPLRSLPLDPLSLAPRLSVCGSVASFLVFTKL